MAAAVAGLAAALLVTTGALAAALAPDPATARYEVDFLTT